MNRAKWAGKGRFLKLHNGPGVWDSCLDRLKAGTQQMAPSRASDELMLTKQW